VATVNRQWRLAQRPTGFPENPIGEGHFRWTEETSLPTPAEGQALVRNLWLSFAPTQVLAWAAPSPDGLPLGDVIPGIATSRVIESRHPVFRAGDLIHGYAGWEDYSVVDGNGYIPTWKVPEGVSPQLASGLLDVTGMVAYFGVVEVGRPRKGENVVVSAAAGGVGSVAAQVAKIQGARVIGIAGGKAKCDWLVGEAGLDAAIDHRSENVATRLEALCPEGIDVYFDNVGGPLLDVVLERIRRSARVVLCGGTSRYARTSPVPGPSNYLALVMVDARMEGLLGRDYSDRFPEAIAALRAWVDSGQLKPKDDVVVGLENAPRAFGRMFTGENLGKQILKIADEPERPAR
jgi:NADPH-dependent curcumin reductase